MKRFFAFWIVSLVFAALAGLFVGLIDYVSASVVEDRAGLCHRTFFAGCFYDPLAIFGMYSLSAIGMMMVAYPIFRAVIGSFRIVFGVNNMSNSKKITQDRPPGTG